MKKNRGGQRSGAGRPKRSGRLVRVRLSDETLAFLDGCREDEEYGPCLDRCVATARRQWFPPEAENISPETIPALIANLTAETIQDFTRQEEGRRPSEKEIAATKVKTLPKKVLHALDDLNRVYRADANDLLKSLPNESVDAIIAEPLTGISGKVSEYDWGTDPTVNDASKWWEFHERIYRQSLRVLRPGGTLAWCVNPMHKDHFKTWFGDYRLWALIRISRKLTGHTWLVQTARRQPVPFPENTDGTIFYRQSWLWRNHPCPLPIQEAEFLVRHLTRPGQVCVDYFAGLGSVGLACAWQGRQFLLGDISKRYCQIAAWRLSDHQRFLLRAGIYQMVAAGKMTPEDAAKAEAGIMQAENPEKFARLLQRRFDPEEGPDA